MSAIPIADDVLDPAVEVLTLREVADRFDRPVSRVQQALRDHQLIAVRRNGELLVPAVFLTDGDEVVKGLPGTITLLVDSGYSPSEILRWLFTADESLPGTPIDALRGDRGREVKRRAQALAF
ncbi:Rv2175c family DNA-binding protein [Kibdelosporangium persicum]|uniref:Transcriptional regulator n=1 Tax=Kibdelosporangium persicum TaxID=2698649 RepID=A0ABX2F9V8_9PSEU|nr:Rv2175c family DNA-binding protein [Kibdelosporangium persicum]NRN68156.1 Transcriptional regulator [Kibdelosporangium persicum]